MNSFLSEILEADYVVIGSGAGGATVAKALAEKGKDVLVLEEGGWYKTADFREDLYTAMKTIFRKFGAQFASGGGALFPVLQGCCVGGSTVMNGAIVHRLPKEAYERWAQDTAIEKNLSYERLELYSKEIEAELGIRANLEPILENLPAVQALRKLNWRYQAMRRNAPGCQETGRCLQGCPSGGKLSMEKSYIPSALKNGARILENCNVKKIDFQNRRATEVVIRRRNSDGDQIVKANKAVVVSAGTVHSPLLLLKSGLRNPHIGQHFQCHLSANVLGILNREVKSVEGPPQGIEVLEFREEKIKLATQLLPPELIFARLPFAGMELVRMMKECAKIDSWVANVESVAEGSVRPSWFGDASIQFAPAPRDMERLRRALYLLAELLFELGAKSVFPGIFGIPKQLIRSDFGKIQSAPLSPKNYFVGAGHIFGTCRMGGSSDNSVVDSQCRVHGTENLYVADGSVFPSAIGVNPQHTIMVLAMHATEGMV